MLAKSTSPGICEWDERLPFVLFSDRASMQSSTGETPFFLLYGRDLLLPTETILSLPVDRRIIDLDDYKSTMMREMSYAWSQAQGAVARAQKQQHDKKTNDPEFFRVFVSMPARKTGHMRKLACPFEGPWRVVALHRNGMDVRLVEKPKSQPIRVALDRVRHCPLEIPVRDKIPRSTGVGSARIGEGD